MLLIHHNQKGFTLVEVVVTSILSVIGAGIILSSFFLTVRETREATSNMTMERLYDMVSYNVGWDVRMGEAVLTNGVNFADRNSTLADTGATSINIYDQGGNVIGGYRVNGTVFEELDGNGNWQHFTAGAVGGAGELVNVVSGGSFNVHAQGKGLEMNIQLTKTVDGYTDTLSIRGDLFRCRNYL